MFFRSLPSLSAVIGLLLLALPALAQDSFLSIDGFLEDAIATDDTYNSGGTLVVNGFTMEVPTNVLVQFPSAWVPFTEFAAQKEDFLGLEIFVRTTKSHTIRHTR